jgi:hypothetical protein
MLPNSPKAIRARLIHSDMKKITWILLLAIAPSALQAQDELPDAKAATEIIESLQGTLGDLSAILSLPPQQRVDWVLNQAADRVQAKMVDKAKDEIKGAMDNYAKAAFRAEAFKTIAIPALKNAAALNTPANWELLEAQMASKVDTKTAAYGAAVAGAAILWDSVDAFGEQGARAGFAKMAAGVYEAVADAYIPGWGWFKLGTTMVEGLGNYVLGYATDTATEGMLNDLFSMKGDPKSFAQMLRTTPLSDINKKVDDGWELVAYGRLWNGQGTDAGDAAMKQRLKDTLYDLKAGVAHEYAIQQQKDAALQAKFQPYLDAAAQAEARLRAVASKVKADAEPLLASTRDLQRRSSQLGEEKYAKEAQTYNDEAESTPGEAQPYTPIPRSGFMPFYTAAYGRVKESTGGSFDIEAFYKEIGDGNNARAQAVNSQTVPPDGAGKLEWLAHRDADRKAIISELMTLQYDADGRAALMAQAISQETSTLATQLNEQAEKLEQGLMALENEAAENLRLPDTFRRYGFPDFTQVWIFNNLQPGFTAENYARIASYLEKLEADVETLQSLNSRRRKLYADYNLLIATAENTMQAVIPQGCQVFTNTVVDSERLRKTWSINNFYYTSVPLVFQDLPLSVIYVRPELEQSEFNPQEAILAAKALLSELQGDYDRWQLQLALERITQILDQKFQPYNVPKPSNHALSLMARVNGILDYRKPLEETDLDLYVQRFESVWLAAQTRIELLQLYPSLVDAAPYLKWGTNLNQYKTLLASDREGRQRAPAQAESLKLSFQQAIDRWNPILVGMNPDYYEEALGGLGSTLANAEVGYVRARSASTATYTLMEDYFRDYIPQVTSLLQQAQVEYTSIISWYGKTMPSITPATNKVNGSVGQGVGISFQVSEPGGTYSVPYLPAGLSVDAAMGTISGKITQAGDFDVVVRYRAPSGVSTHSLVHLGVAPPAGVTQVLTLNNGYPEMKLQGVEGINYIVQILNDMGGDNRWVTVKTLTLGKDQTWVDIDGMLASHRFYRLVWVQP